MASPRSNEGISQKQVAVADRLILTKLDIAGAAQCTSSTRRRTCQPRRPERTARHQPALPVRLWDARCRAVGLAASMVRPANGRSVEAVARRQQTSRRTRLIRSGQRRGALYHLEQRSASTLPASRRPNISWRVSPPDQRFARSALPRVATSQAPRSAKQRQSSTSQASLIGISPSDR
jgi:G3E family GTPase